VDRDEKRQRVVRDEFRVVGGFYLKQGQGVVSRFSESENDQDFQAVKVTLFGRQYNVRGHGAGEYVEKLVDFINARSEEIKEKSKVVTTFDLAVLTLLNVTDEFFQCRQTIQDGIEKVEEEQNVLLTPCDLEETDVKIPLRSS